MFEDVSRVLLVECINADQFPGQIAGIFPLLKGWLAQRGRTCRWIRYGVSTANLHTHGRDSVTLDDAEMAVLRDAVEDLRPEILVHTHPLFDDHLAEIRRVVPTVRLVGLVELEAGMRWGHNRAALVPDYRFEAGNAAAARDDRQNVYVLVRDGCGYRRSVANNPCYADVELPEGTRSQGCAFCGMRSADPGHGGQETRDWITRQLRAIHADYPAAGRHLNALLFENIENPDDLAHALRLLDELGMTGVKALVGARTDRLVQSADVLRRWLGDREGSAAGLHVFVSGLENFAADELLRMNKGTTPLDGLRAVNLLQELELRYPDNFNYSGYAPFSVVLFTPWTTFADLHLNLRLIQHLGIEDQVGNLFMARLRLHTDVAMTYLAERDGVLVDDVDDTALRLNRRKLFREERAWRFLEPRLEPVNRIATRLEPDDAFAGDALYESVQALLRDRRAQDADASGEGARRRLVEGFLCVVDVACAHDDVLPVDRLLAEAAALRDARHDPTGGRDATDGAPGGRASLRIGATALPLAAWLDRVAPLVRDGLVPTLALEDLGAEDVAGFDGAPLRRAGLEYLLEAPRNDRPGAIVIGTQRAAVARRLALGKALAAGAPREERQAALEEAARLLGAPGCCAEAWARSPWARALAGGRWRGWLAVAQRAAVDGPLAGLLDPMLLPDLVVPPCRPDCEAARAHAAALADRLGADARADDRIHVFPLAPEAPDELVLLPLVERTPDGLRYDPEGLPGAADGEAAAAPLLARLREGDRLRFTPGQVQLWRGERLVDLWTAQVGVWDPDRVPDPDFWSDLAVAALRRADPEARAAKDVAAARAREGTADARLRTGAGRSPAATAAARSGQAEGTAADDVPAIPPGTPLQRGGEGLQLRAGTLRIAFVDRRGALADLTFYLGAVEDGDPAVVRVGRLGLAHDPCPTDTRAFQLCVRTLETAMRAAPTPPGGSNRLSWERIVHRAVARTALARRFHCTVDQV